MDPKLKVGTIITKNGLFFLIKERFNTDLNYGWNICAGGWDPEDQSLVHTAIREAKEEGGLDIEIQGLYKIALVNLDSKFKLQFVFVGKTSEEGTLPSKESQLELNEDIIAQKWFSTQEILAMNESEFVSSTVAQIVKEYVASPTFSQDITTYFDHETKF